MDRLRAVSGAGRDNAALPLTFMHYVLTFGIMLGFWIFLSGRFDAFHLALGVISSAIVTGLSHDLLFEDREKRGRLAEAGRFLRYVPWLMKEIVLATFHVVKLALHPRMEDLLDPRVVSFRSGLLKDISKVTLANSITLTPGTITIYCEGEEFCVHAISEQTAEATPGEMESRVAAIFEVD